MPGARCTRSLAWEKIEPYERRHREVHRFHPAFPHAMVLTVSSVIFPVIGFVVTVISGILPANLTPASRRQNHTTSPSAARTVRQQHVRVHRIPSRVRDDRERPLVGRDGAGYGFDLGEKRRSLFLQSGLDRPNQIEAVQEITFYLHRANPRGKRMSASGDVPNPIRLRIRLAR